MLVTGRFVPVMSNSDTHGPGTPIGTPQTVVHARTLSVPAIVARFGADMAIDIHADGPVTIVLDVPA